MRSLPQLKHFHRNLGLPLGKGRGQWREDSFMASELSEGPESGASSSLAWTEVPIGGLGDVPRRELHPEAAGYIEKGLSTTIQMLAFDLEAFRHIPLKIMRFTGRPEHQRLQ